MSIRAEAASWRAGGRLIVDGVHLAAGPGSTVGILGPNGSGKSSLLRLLAGLRRTSSGVVVLGEDDITGISRRQVARRLAVVDQESTTDTSPTVRDVVGLGRLPHRPPWAPISARDRRVIEEAATTTRTVDLLDREYDTLSGGERQRVQIARALAQEPTELLLDEPTNHLDIRHQLELLQLVHRADTTTIMALHDLNLAAAFCDEVVIMQSGRVHSTGSPQEVLTRELIAQVYEVEAETTVVDGRVRVHFVGPVRPVADSSGLR